MKYAKQLSGNYPVVMDVPVYDAGTMNNGELVMRGAHGGTTNSYFITAYVSASANEAVAALGALQETSTSNTAIASTGFTFLKCIINPTAVYTAEYLQTTGNVIDVTSASTSTTLTTTNLEDNIDGGWIYFTAKTVSTAVGAGSLRYLTASGSGSATMDSAVTIDTTSDFIKILPISHRLTSLDTTAVGLLSKAIAGADVSIQVIENWIDKNGGRQMLRYAAHKGLNGLDKDTTKFYASIVLLDHSLNQT